MLVLTRQRNESIIIGDGLVTVQIVDIRGDKVRLGITAPPEMHVDREEVAVLRAEAALATVRRAQGKAIGTVRCRCGGSTVEDGDRLVCQLCGATWKGVAK